MKYRIVVLVMLLLMLSGCSFLKELFSQTDPNDLIIGGEFLAGTAPFFPGFSVILYLAGGLIVLAGNVIKQYKEKT